MIAASVPRATAMYAVRCIDDSFAAVALLAQAMTDDPDLFDRLAPGATTYDAVELADDESVAVFHAYAADGWELAELGEPVARIVVVR